MFGLQPEELTYAFFDPRRRFERLISGLDTILAVMAMAKTIKILDEVQTIIKHHNLPIDLEHLDNPLK